MHTTTRLPIVSAPTRTPVRTLPVGTALVLLTTLTLAGEVVAKGPRPGPVPTPDAMGVDVKTPVKLVPCPGLNKCDDWDGCQAGKVTECKYAQVAAMQVSSACMRDPKRTPCPTAMELEGPAMKACQLKDLKSCSEIGRFIRRDPDLPPATVLKTRAAWASLGCSIATEKNAPEKRGLCAQSAALGKEAGSASELSYDAHTAEIQAIADAKKSLKGMDLSGKKLAKLNLNGVDLTGVRFDQADLREASITNCTLTGASFVGAKVTQATISGTGAGVVLKNLNLGLASVFVSGDDVVFDDVSLNQSQVSIRGARARITGVKGGSSSNLEVNGAEATLQNIKVKRSTVTGRLEKSTVNTLIMEKGALSLDVQDGSTLENVQTTFTDLRGLDITDSHLRKAVFEGAPKADLDWMNPMFDEVAFKSSELHFSINHHNGLVYKNWSLCDCPKCTLFYYGGYNFESDGCLREHITK